MIHRKAGRVVAAALVATLVPVVSAQGSRQESRLQSLVSVVPAALHEGPADARATIVIFSDFQCPVCARTPAAIKELLKAYPDQLRIVFKHNPLAIHPDAPLAHEAALVAATQGKFWEMHDLLFANQRLLKEANLRLYAQQVGLDMAAFDAAMKDRRFKPLVDEALIEVRGLGITSTPTFFINGRRVNGLPSVAVLRSHVDAALGLAPTTTSTSTELKPGDIDLADAPTLGREDAPVTMVEFSDLQCPFCARTVATAHEILKAYPRDVKWVFKHFPLDIHDDAPLAHRAALAAKAQGKFWEFHDAVFATQRQMKRQDLIDKADAIGLDVKRFTAELDTPEYKAKVDADKAEGRRLAVGGTPTFFINGRRVSGAKSVAEFKAVVEAALKDRTWSTTGTRGATARAAGDDDPSAPVMRKGRADAPIELEWYSDLRSPLTPKAAELVSALLQKYPERVRLTLRHRPLPDLRPDSRLAHEAAMAAAAQGKFWEMHDRIISTRETLTRATLADLAAQVGLNRDKFLADLDGGTYKAAVDRDLAEAQSREIRGTPVFFVDGRRVDGLQSIATFEKLFPAEPALAEAKP